MKKFLFYLVIAVLISLTFGCPIEIVVEPTIYPDGRVFTTNQEIIIDCPTIDATIKYTLDGTDPSSTNGIEIESGDIFILVQPATVKAIAYKSGCLDSTIKSSIFYFQVEQPTILTDTILGFPQEITIASSTTDATIYYTIDDTEPDDNSTLYSAPFTITENTTVKAIAYKIGYGDSRVKVTNFIADSYVHVLVQGGTFSMGSTTGDADEKPVHDATVSDFYISEYETTQSEYEAVMNDNPCGLSGYGEGPDKPVYYVSWYDAVAYCNALSIQEGLPRYYYGSEPNIFRDFSSIGYRLPTEAEWEYASRGGASSLGYIYSGSDTCIDVAWCDDNNVSDKCNDVGTKAANELGIYDMSGNVYEWCWDWYDSAYYSHPTADDLDTLGPYPGIERVLRGGFWDGSSYACRSTNRYYYTPSYSNRHVGFRIVRTP